MKVLITGGAGFIGSNLARYHMEAGDEVYVVDDLSTGTTENLKDWLEHPNFKLYTQDLLTWDGLYAVAARAERVYHMAALVGMFRVIKEPIRVMAINVAGTERLLRAIHAAEHNPRVIVASSSEVYGENPCKLPDQPLDEELDLNFHANRSLRWNYAISKLADEALSISYAKQHGMPVTAVRFFNTVGPGQTGRYGMVVPRFVRQAVNKEPITVFGEGNQKRCFCDVRDTVRILDLLAGNQDACGEVVNVGNQQEISIMGLAEKVRETSGNPVDIVRIPYEEAYGMDFTDIFHRKPELSKMLRLTDYQHRWDLDDTLQDLVARQRADRETPNR